MNRHILNINILDHPTNRNTIVYFYTENLHSQYFKSLLTENSISFEYQFDEEEKKHYFGIKRTDDKKVKTLNYLVFAKFRKPFINNPVAKYLLVSLTLLFIILAIIGFLIS